MAGYTRQSTFADGDTITAALFNNEYNQLLNAFSNTSGHKHDGTANEGPVIGLIGDAGVVTPLNKVLIDSTNDHIEFWVDVSSSSVQQLYIADGAIVPVTDSDVDLGTTGLRFKDAYIDTVTTTGNVAVGGNLTVTGTTTFNGGTITMGDAATDNVVFGADVDSNIIPDDDDAYDLGSSSQEWRNLYIDGTANIDSLVADTADINGGTIDGATIATSDITVGSGKTLNVSAGTLTLADNQISGDKVEGGTINATTINTLTYGSITDGTITVTAFVDEDNMASNSATLIPTQQSVKAYVDAQDTAQDLDLVSDSGTIAIDLDGETLTVTGGEGIDTSASSNTLTITGEDATTSNKGIASFNSDDFNVSSGAVTLATTSTAAELNLLDGTTAGTIVASKGVAVDANKDITGFRNITLTGELDAGSLDISGNADIDGTLEADAITIAGVTLAETISDTVGAMVASNTETGIAVTYDDADNTLDFVIGDNAIVQSMIADNAIDSQMYVDGSIDLVHMSANSVDSDQYVDGSIDTAHIADSQITSAKIVDGTIATGDIADDAVTGAKLANNIDIAGTLDVTGVLTADSNVVIAGNLTVQGDTTTLNTATLDVEDKNITLNKGAGDTSGSANGAGLTIQDAVDASNDATILWDTTNDEFDFSHPINVAGKVTSTGTSVFASLDISGDIDVDGTTNLDVVDIDGASNFGADATFLDGVKANFGSGSDLQISHTGSNSLIADTGTGDLKIRGNNLKLEAFASEDSYVTMVDGGAVTLFHDNSAKLATTSTGIDVTGVITSKADGAVNDAQIGRLNFTNTNSNASSNPIRASILSGRQNSAWGGYLSLYTSTGTDAASEKVRIGETGNVGIGMTPTYRLDVTNNSTGIQGRLSSSSSSGTSLSFQNSATNGRNYRIGTNFVTGAGEFSIYDDTASAERMKIDASGNLLVSKTSSDTLGTAGHELHNSGMAHHTRATGTVLYLNRTGNDGNIIDLRKDNTTVGSIGSIASDLYIAESNSGLRFDGENNQILPSSTTASTDGTCNLGATSARFKNLHLSGYASVNALASPDGTSIVYPNNSGNVGVGVSDIGSAGLSLSNSMNFNISEGANSSFVNIFRQASSAATVIANGYKYTDTANKVASSYASSWAKSAIALNYGNTIFYNDTAATTAVGTDVTPTERMRIDSSGDVMIGNTTVNPASAHSDQKGFGFDTSLGSLEVAAIGGSAGVFGLNQSANTDIVVFRKQGTQRGSVYISDGGTTYNTSSDARLKNVLGEAKGLEIVNKLNAVNFEWKESKEIQDGLIAQEVEELIPHAVSKNADGYYQMDYSMVVTPLIKAIQEQQEQIDALQSEINLLKGE